MKLNGRRLSNNVDDRRGSGRGGGRIAGVGGIVTVAIVALVTWLAGGDPLSVIGSQLFDTATEQTYTPTAQEEELATFTRQILAGTEDVWADQFKRLGLEYEPPRLVMFTGSVQSACGGATASTGPFYCSADRSVYIDLSFFQQMSEQMGAGGDFAYAYVIAHEVGHHVQNLLGTLSQAHDLMSRLPEREANQISVRLELQADYYAGVWAYHDNRLFGSLEPGDIEEGLNAASKIGDDYLQKQARGYTVPDSFNHGRSDQRVRWLKKGASTGSINGGDTFTPVYSDL